MTRKPSKNIVISMLEFHPIRAYMLGVWLFVSALYIVYVSILNQVSEDGLRLQQLETLNKQIMAENQILENQIASEASLSKIEVKAKEMGFVPIGKNVQYIK